MAAPGAAADWLTANRMKQRTALRHIPGCPEGGSPGLHQLVDVGFGGEASAESHGAPGAGAVRPSRGAQGISCDRDLAFGGSQRGLVLSPLQRQCCFTDGEADGASDLDDDERPVEG